MRRLKSILFLLALFVCLSGCGERSDADDEKNSEVRAMWLSYMDISLLIDSSETQTIANIEQMLENCKTLGINRLFVHASAFTDAYYASEFYPWARGVNGEIGKEGSIDPLKEICRLAAMENIEVEAWINPLRSFTVAEMDELSGEYPVKVWAENSSTNGTFVVQFNGRYYLNPYYTQTRDLILKVVRELLENYQISGIHMDDYFYPEGIGTDFDEDAYRDYQSKGGTLSLSDFRRENVNTLVREIYACVKSIDESKVFGISPAGNISYSTDTIYGDVGKWVQNAGYIDYIAPQIYFGFEHGALDFQTCLKQWKELISEPSVDLIIGLAAYKAGTEDAYALGGSDEWINNSDILARQVKIIREDADCSGFALYSYRFLFAPEQSLIEAAKQQLENLFEVLR